MFRAFSVGSTASFSRTYPLRTGIIKVRVEAKGVCLFVVSGWEGFQVVGVGCGCVGFGVVHVGCGTFLVGGEHVGCVGGLKRVFEACASVFGKAVRLVR